MVKGLDNILSVRVDFNFADPCYVLQLAAAQHAADVGTVAAALSNDVIKLYHHHVADLQPISSLQGHSDRITDVHLPLPSLVLSSSDDGTVRVWDSRSGTEAEKYALLLLVTAFQLLYVSILCWNDTGERHAGTFAPMRRCTRAHAQRT